MNLKIPELSLVVLIGASGAGKSSFARKHFKPTEILSSDFCRGLIADDENDQSATDRAFEVLHFIASKRLEAGRLTVIDATNVQEEARKPLIELARKYHFLLVAIVFKVPERVCLERNKQRPERSFGDHVIRNQFQSLRRSLRGLAREGFRYAYVLDSVEEVDSATIERQPLWNNRTSDHGPFDIVGDIHGCFDELQDLLLELGYQVSKNGEIYDVQHPDGRRVVFLGDLVDRGPKTPEVLRLAMDMTASGSALCVPGNHDIKLMRKLRGQDVRITHGLAESLEQLDKETPAFKEEVLVFLDKLVSHFVLDDGKLVVAHAGMKTELQGRGSGRVRDFALYGETTGETDEFGLPVRYNWAADYRGRAIVVYGHTPVPEPEWLNGTINVDTGCVFGGKLTALRYPERDIISVPARFTYYESVKPFLDESNRAPEMSVQHHLDDLLDIEDVTGKRIISTRLQKNIIVREENSITALEVMSRFAANPKWLIYLPPTISPCETSSEFGLLEHPSEALQYYRRNGIDRVICEEKHMGSRAVVIVCKNEEVTGKRFGIVDDGAGICYTRTGRRFFDDRNMEIELLNRIRDALDACGFWSELGTDWVCLDCELMPWSAKAQELLRTQYAAAGTSGRMSTAEAIAVLEQGAQQNSELVPMLERFRLRAAAISYYVEAYRRYCWPVNSVSDLRVAPFHILATEGAVHSDKDHLWHLQMIGKILSGGDELLAGTEYTIAEVTDPGSVQAATQWWIDKTEEGMEGMVVKPLPFLSYGSRGLLQPAVKCRGREYLRIIYGPEYTLSENLERLRKRSLGAKQSLAIREFALGLEALQRFVQREPLRRVHECVFGVLAMESEPVDPRL